EKSVPQAGPAATTNEEIDNVGTGSSGTGPFLLSPAHPEVSVPQAGPAVFKHEGQSATQTKLFTLEERRDVIRWLHVCN
ncbi:MAG: hypothetical protein JZU64_18160, partial [Rhodoferax sp.]|nr:hypothetical protein [Rhodoferax sp.]